MARYKKETLEGKSVKELRRLVVDLGIPGYTKTPKATIVDAIFAKYGVGAKSDGTISKAAASSGPVSQVSFEGESILTKPSAPFGSKTTTTLRVSCGASSGKFPVTGKTVKEVGEFLREVLNVSTLSTGLVNGKEVPADYILKAGDTLEFLKPAGKKGC
jgi:hypothetical protein